MVVRISLFSSFLLIEGWGLEPSFLLLDPFLIIFSIAVSSVATALNEPSFIGISRWASIRGLLDPSFVLLRALRVIYAILGCPTW